MSKNKAGKKIKDFSSSVVTKTKAMSLGKKIYALLWLITGSFLIAIISMFVSQKDKYVIMDETHNNMSQYVDIEKMQPDNVLIQNNLLDEDNYYVQALQDFELDGKPGITKDYDTSNGKYPGDWRDDYDHSLGRYEGDIVHGVFYPLSKIRQWGQVDPANGHELWNWKEGFHAAGWREPEVIVKPNQTVVLMNPDSGVMDTLTSGMPVSLKRIYDSPSYYGRKNSQGSWDIYEPLQSSADSEKFIHDNFDIESINKNENSNVPANEPQGNEDIYIGKMAYDLERVDRENNNLTPVFKPNKETEKVINDISIIAWMFLGSMIAAIFSTTIVSIYEKKEKKGKV